MTFKVCRQIHANNHSDFTMLLIYEFSRLSTKIALVLTVGIALYVTCMRPVQWCHSLLVLSKSTLLLIEWTCSSSWHAMKLMQ